MQAEIPSQEEMADVWDKIKIGIDKKRQRRKQKYILVTMTSAAAIIGLMWLGGNGYFLSDKSDISVIAAKMADESIEEGDIRLIVSEEEVLHVKKGATVAYSQEGIVSVDEEKVSKNTTKDLYDQIIVPKGKYTRLILADGSNLHINAGTRVIYPKRFEKNRREIFVDGEIFIDVKRDESAPFIVKTAQFDVQVLGTAFDIKAYSDTSEDAEVVLVRGKVNVKSKLGNELELLPDNKATVLSNGLIEKSFINAEEYVLWTKGILSLNNDPLNEILAKLERYYGVDINCTDNISTIKITGKIDLECGVEAALKRISATGGFSFLKQGDTYVLKPLENIVQ
jgi:hypothetical protein